MSHRKMEEYVGYYLDRLESDESAWYALVEADAAALPILAMAFRSERDSEKRATILEIIWQHRDPFAIPVLGQALNDPAPVVWKEALDGLVALGRAECISVIQSAQARRFDREADAVYFRRYLDDAIDQLRHGAFGEPGGLGND